MSGLQGRLIVVIKKAAKLTVDDEAAATTYASVELDAAQAYKSHAIAGGRKPEWEKPFFFGIHPTHTDLLIKVLDVDTSEVLGTCRLDLQSLLHYSPSKTKANWWPLTNNQLENNDGGRIKITCEFHGTGTWAQQKRVEDRKKVRVIQEKAKKALIANRYRLLEAWRLMDLNGDRAIDHDEFVTGLRRLLPDVDDEGIELFWQSSDTNKDGKLSCREFADRFRLSTTTSLLSKRNRLNAAVNRHALENLQGLLNELHKGHDGALKQLFKRMDKDGDNQVSCAEMKDVLKAVFKEECQKAIEEKREVAEWAKQAGPLGVRDTDVDVLFKALDEDHSNKVDIHEFVKGLHVVDAMELRIERDPNSKDNKNDQAQVDHKDISELIDKKLSSTMALANHAPRCFAYRSIAEHVMLPLLQQGIPNIILAHSLEDTAYSRQATHLRFEVLRVVDIQKIAGCSVMYVIFSLTFVSLRHNLSVYHARVDFDQEEQVVAIKYEGVETREDFEITERSDVFVIEGWPEDVMRYF